MTPGARITAMIEALSQLEQSWAQGHHVPADKLLERFFKARRYMGSKDRGAVAAVVYRVLRQKLSLHWWIEQHELAPSPRLLVIAALVLGGDMPHEELARAFTDGSYAPGAMSDDELSLAHYLQGKPLAHPDMPQHVRLNYPEWLTPHLREAFGDVLEQEVEALSQEASVDLRTNTLVTTRDALMRDLRAQGVECEPSPASPNGIRLTRRAPVFTLPQFKAGAFEMQDEGSQMVAALVGARPGHKVIDFCAGAGGKTLAIAADMHNKGRILAWDTSAKRLAELSPRMARAKVSNVQPHVIESESDAFIKRHKYSADRVLVDAPCSGLGTWRRNPDLKWRSSEKGLAELLQIQAKILASAARLVKPGGRLIYATCSLLKNENEQQVESFLSTTPQFRVVCAKKIWDKSFPKGTTMEQSQDSVSYLWVTPRQDGVDGFFAAVLERVTA